MSVPTEVFAVQPLIVGFLLLVAAALKWVAPSSHEMLARQRAFAALELALAVAILALPSPLAGVCVILFAVAATGVLIRRRVSFAGAGCGCMGRFSDRNPISWRTFARPWLLVALTAPAIASDARWYRALPTLAGVVAAAAGFAIVGLAFPELKGAARAFRLWVAARNLRARTFDCDRGPLSEAEAAQATIGSAAYEELKVHGLVRVPQEWWAEDCWVFAAYDCVWESRPAVAVIAGHASGDSRGAIVDPRNQAVLYEYEPKPACGHCHQSHTQPAFSGLP